MKMREKDKKSTKNSKDLVCYNCGKTGHFKADCFKKKKDDKIRTNEAVKGKKKEFYNKKGKRAMTAAWTDEEDVRNRSITQRKNKNADSSSESLLGSKSVWRMLGSRSMNTRSRGG